MKRNKIDLKVSSWFCKTSKTTFLISQLLKNKSLTMWMKRLKNLTLDGEHLKAVARRGKKPGSDLRVSGNCNGQCWEKSYQEYW